MPSKFGLLATKKTFGELYTKFKRATTGKGQPIEIGEEMTSIKSDSTTSKPQPGYTQAREEDDEEDEDERLSRKPTEPSPTPGASFFSRKDGYQPVPLEEKKEPATRNQITR